MTKNERIEFARLKSKLYSVEYELKQGIRDYDCKWPISILNELKEALTIISKLKC